MVQLVRSGGDLVLKIPNGNGRALGFMVQVGIHGWGGSCVARDVTSLGSDGNGSGDIQSHCRYTNLSTMKEKLL